MFCGLFFGFCCFVLMGKPSNTLLINVLAIRIVFGDICGEVDPGAEKRDFLKARKSLLLQKTAKNERFIILDFLQQVPRITRMM